MKVLIVEDDEKLIKTYENILIQSFDLILANDLATAKKVIKNQAIDVVILDIMLPDGLGYDLIPSIKKHTDAIIIMASALDEEITRRKAYHKGADDYMIKPITLFELEYKLKALQSRKESDKFIYTIGDLSLDLEKLTLTSATAEVQLQHSQSMVLKMLYDKYRQGQILYKKDLTNLENNDAIDNFRIHTLISRLRKNIEELESNLVLIENVYGQGYKLVVLTC